MAKLEPVMEPRKQQQLHSAKKIKTNKFFVLVDYIFLLIFFAFLCFIIFKMFGL